MQTQARSTTTDRRIVTELLALMRDLAAEVRRTGSPVQITVSQFSTLRLLEQGDVSVGELARTLHVAMPTVTQSSESLVSKGLVERYPDGRDRRYVRLRITDEGRALLVQCDEALVSHIAQALVSWPEERRRAFVDCLDDVRDALRPEAARAA